MRTSAAPAAQTPRSFRMSVFGHEERFPPTRLSAGCGFRKETIAGMRRNGRDVPFPVIRGAGLERRCYALKALCGHAQDCRIADETVIRTRPRTGQWLAHVNWS